ncbi:MAG: DNA repair protein RecN [Enterococcus sp.]
MLLELNIKNFAIIAELRLTFQAGMTVLTGETGAGKSIIIDALGLLAGSRSSSDFIRQGSQKCTLEGLFEIPQQGAFLELAQELGLELEEGQLIVQRDITTAGKNVCRVNGRTLTLANLRRVGHFLVDIQGQNEHQELLQPEQHLHLLDQFGDRAFQELRARYQIAYQEMKELAKNVRQLQQNEQSFAQRIDMLQFQQEEIAQAQLQIDEEVGLLEEREKLINHQKIVDALAQSYGALANENSSSLDGVALALQEVQGVAMLDTEYEQISEGLQSAYYLLQDAVTNLSRQMDNLEFDEERLEEIIQRLELIRQLKRKYGDSVATILNYFASITKELAESDYSEEKLEQLTLALTKSQSQTQALAEQLHQKRQILAEQLEQAIVQELKALYMENSQFAVCFNQQKQLQETGFDEVQFYLTTNPGEPLKPLVKVASGGELSRILLALKTIFSKIQGITSIIFDEVDTGVSGRVAQAIAEKIAAIADHSQVLCITHLPQVAANADAQYLIEKDVQAGRTQTHVRQLSAKQRVAEIARMLSGAEVTDLTKQHAQELLALAQKRST